MSTRETYIWRFVFWLSNTFIIIIIIIIIITLCFNLCLRRLFEMVEELRSPYMMLLLVMLYPLTLVIRYVLSFLHIMPNGCIFCYLVLNWSFLGPCWWSFDHRSLSCNWWIKYDWGEQNCKYSFLSPGKLEFFSFFSANYFFFCRSIRIQRILFWCLDVKLQMAVELCW